MPHNIYDTGGRKVGEIRSSGEDLAGLGLIGLLLVPLLLIGFYALPFYALFHPEFNWLELQYHGALLNHIGLVLFSGVWAFSVLLIVDLVHILTTGSHLSGTRAFPDSSTVVGRVAWTAWWTATWLCYVRDYLRWLF